ncbi:heat shock protein DnaJ, partial [Neoconidiobolus thromboides FSU 785]
MQPNSKTRLYTILKVDKAATNDELKRSYKRLALQHHPDKNPNDLDLFKQIKHAYDILSDPKKRKIYDKYGERGL